MRTFSVVFFCTFLLLSIQSYSQVPNGSFEQWSNGEPVGWSTDNSILGTLVTQSNEAHGGSYAVKGENISYNSSVLEPVLISGELTGHGFPISQRYASLQGYYKLNSVNNDVFNVIVAMFNNGEAIGIGGLQFPGASSYSLFTVPIYYSYGLTPDSCQITFTIANNSGPDNAGSYFLIDDLTLEGSVTGIAGSNNSNPYSFALKQNYPNPFNPSTRIEYSVPENSFVTLTVYDVLGKEIKTLVNEEKSAGIYAVNFNAASIPSGVYFYRLTAGNFTAIKKMLLMK